MLIKPETIGDRIRIARKEKGLTQTELGERIGVSGTAIMRYEKGEREPKIQVFCDIAKALNVSEDYLLLMTDDSIPKDNFLSTALALGMDEHMKRITEASEDTQEALEYGVITQKINQRAAQLRQQGSDSKRVILSQEEIKRQIATAEQEHKDCLEKLCFDPTMPDEDYPARIRYVTSFIEKNSDTLKLAMPGTHMAPDDIEEAKKIRATGGTPDSSK